MAVQRTVKSKIPVATKEPKEVVEKEEVPAAQAGEASEGSEKENYKRKTTGKKVCFFDKSKTNPHYWDATALRKFISDRGRISSRTRTGTCAKHQRKLAKEIKRARHLALLPFTPRV